MTDQELAVAAWVQLTQTTDPYPTWVRKGKPASSHWAKAKVLLDQIGPTPVPTPTPDWSRVLAPGDDLNTLRSIAKAGDRIGLPAGASYPISNDGWHIHGSASEPIVIGSVDPTQPAKISGRLDMRGDFAYVNFQDLLFRDNTVPFTTYQVSWVLGGNHVSFTRCDFSNNGTKIGMEQINDSTYGVGSDNLLDRCRFHTIGRHPWGSTNNDHGLYDVGLRMHVVDCVFADCSDRGIQARGAHDALYEQVTISGCGEGIIFGDIGAVNVTLRKAILVNNKVASRALIEEYDPSGHDSSNRVEDTFAWNADGRKAVGGTHAVTFSNLHNVDPQLDASLLPVAGSPAAGYGCRVGLPVWAV